MQRHFDWLEDIRQQAAALSKRSAKEPFLLPKVSKLSDSVAKPRIYLSAPASWSRKADSQLRL